MARRAPDPDKDILELTPDMQADEPPEDEPGEGEDEDEEEDEEAEAGEEEEDEGEGEEETVIGFEDEAGEGDGKADSSVIRRLRERNKELARENTDLRKAAPAPEVELGPKPTLSDVDYDEDKFEAALDSWKDRKRQIEDGKTARDAEAETAEREWRRDLENYETRAKKLAVPDFAEAAEIIASTLTLAQQAVIVKVAQDAPAFVYGLGHSDARLAELAKIQDPIKLAAAVARMEGGLKVVKRRKGPAPDRPAKGSVKMPGGTDKQLEKLETEAEKTGDRTAVIAYKKKLTARAKAK